MVEATPTPVSWTSMRTIEPRFRFDPPPAALQMLVEGARQTTIRPARSDTAGVAL
jgi:hypothetical protein